MAPRRAVEVGEQLPELTLRVTRADLAHYADVSGDRNPIHRDDRAARSAGLPGVVAHGMLVMALAGRAVTAWTGDHRALVSYDLRFTRPVVVPDDAAGATVTIGGKVADVTEAGQARLLLTVHDAEATVVGRASAVVRLGG